AQGTRQISPTKSKNPCDSMSHHPPWPADNRRSGLNCRAIARSATIQGDTSSARRQLDAQAVTAVLGITPNTLLSGQFRHFPGVRRRCIGHLLSPYLPPFLPCVSL